jgi:hypothetical protein
MSAPEIAEKVTMYFLRVTKAPEYNAIAKRLPWWLCRFRTFP